MKYYSFHLRTNQPIQIQKSLLDYKGRRVFFDGEKIICRKQVLAAIDRASRAFEQNVAVANDWGIEVLLHLTGTHQISEALKLVNISKTTKLICLVQDSPEKPDNHWSNGFPNFNPKPKILEEYGLTSNDSCKQVLVKGVEFIVNHE